MSAADDADDGTEPELVGTIEVAIITSPGESDVYGGRKRSGGQLRHLGNADPGTPGWLGNPHEMDDDTVAERRRVIAAYLRDFCQRVESDPEFRAAVQQLRGKTVECWCRGVSQERTPSNWCHLDVVAAWLDGDLSPVYDYLRGADDAS